MLYCKIMDTFCSCVDETDGTCVLWYGCKYEQEDQYDYRDPVEEEFNG